MTFSNIKLKAKIVEKFASQEKFAEALGCTPVTVNKKVNGKAQFKLDEIEKWSQLLGIAVDDIGQYFFCKEC